MSAAPAGWVLVKGSGGGGLGDRLRAVLVAVAYARATGRGVAVDWRDGLLGPPGRDAFEGLFALADVPWAAPATLDAATDVAPEAWAGRVGRSLHDVYVEDGDPPWDRAATIARYAFDVTDPDPGAHVLVLWDFDRLPRLAASARFNPEGRELAAFERELVARHLRVAPRVEARVTAARRVEHGPERWVGVHVRATHESRAQRGEVPLAAYFEAVDHLLDQGPRSLWLATDNADVERAFRARYEHVATLPKWFAAPGQPLHLDPSCPDRWQATEDAVVDLVALARCDDLVLRAHSSFSEVARLLSGHAPSRCRRLAVPPPAWPTRWRRRLGRLLSSRRRR